MIEYVLIFIIIFLAFFISKYYFKPKAQIKKYKSIFKKLGYRVYQQPFAFFGLSFFIDTQNGVKNHKDAFYTQKTVYSQIDIAIGNVMNKTVVVLVNPDLIKEFLSANFVKLYPKFTMLITGTKAALGEGVLFSQGQIWKTKRKVMSRVFNFDLIKENITSISQICDKCFNQYDNKYKIAEKTFKYNTTDVGVKIFNGVMMKCFFGWNNLDQELGGMKYDQFIIKTMTQTNQLGLSPLIAILGQFGWKYGLTAKIRHLKHSIQLLRQKATSIIRKRTEQVTNSKKQQKVKDIIQAMIYQKISNDNHFDYNDKDLLDEFQTFLVAGTDTTSRYFTMMIYYLGKYPQIHKKLRKQINSIIKTDEDISYDKLKQLVYIDWIQLETTRFYGPANGVFFRQTSQDNYLKDVPIAKGTILTYQPLGNHYNDQYFKDPFLFRPQRWESQCNLINPYAFLGFSAGARSCIGKQLALLSSKIALVKFMRRYESIEVPQEITMNSVILYQAQKFDTILKQK